MTFRTTDTPSDLKPQQSVAAKVGRFRIIAALVVFRHGDGGGSSGGVGA